MDNQKLENLIAGLPLVERFSEHEKEVLAREVESSLVSYDAGTIIIQEGAEHGALYLLLEGSVLITKSGYDYIVAQLSAGAIFGEMSFFTKKPRHSNVIASDDVLVVKMDEDFFGQISPGIKDKIKNFLIEVLINRLDEMTSALVKISRG